MLWQFFHLKLLTSFSCWHKLHTANCFPAQISYRSEAVKSLFCDALWNSEKLQKTTYSSLISADLDFQRCQKGKFLSYKGTNIHSLTRTALLSQSPLHCSGLSERYISAITLCLESVWRGSQSYSPILSFYLVYFIF